MQHQQTADLDRRPIKARNSRPAQIIAHWLSRIRVPPNGISVAGMLASIVAGGLLYLTGGDYPAERAMWLAAAFLILLRLTANMLDGMVAIESGQRSPIGELYNEVPDRISDAAIWIGAGYAAGGGVELGFLAACLALFVAYVRAMAKTAGAPSDFCGPMAKQQRMFVLAGAAVFMGVSPLAWQFHWGPGSDWGIVSAVLLMIVVGSAVTSWRRLAHAAGYLHRTPSSRTAAQPARR